MPIIADRDGHDYIDGALQAGAGAYLTSRPARGRTAIVVPDTLVALMQLGTWARNKLDSQLENRVIAITGSVGKLRRRISSPQHLALNFGLPEHALV